MTAHHEQAASIAQNLTRQEAEYMALTAPMTPADKAQTIRDLLIKVIEQAAEMGCDYQVDASPGVGTVSKRYTLTITIPAEGGEG